MAGTSRNQGNKAAERYLTASVRLSAWNFTKSRSNALADLSKGFRADIFIRTDVTVDGADHAIIRLGLIIVLMNY